MLVKDLKQELNKFSDETQIFIGVKDEDDSIMLSDFFETTFNNAPSVVILVATKAVTLASLFQLNKEE